MHSHTCSWYALHLRFMFIYSKIFSNRFSLFFFLFINFSWFSAYSPFSIISANRSQRSELSTKCASISYSILIWNARAKIDKWWGQNYLRSLHLCVRVRISVKDIIKYLNIANAIHGLFYNMYIWKSIHIKSATCSISLIQRRIIDLHALYALSKGIQGKRSI